ncbi:MAG: rRNA maturation RNase YbeY [Bacteroidales bacterium]|nr:rRNA maturation RNase YbeY [Bacteroidales bacterium]
MAIHFHEKEESAGIKNKNLLKKWLKDLILQEHASPGQINIVLTSDNNVLELNNKYLSRNYLTDIITFDYTENQVIAGDLFISVTRVRENSEKFDVTFKKELKRVIVHGVLHLLGYGDGTQKEKSLMQQMEDRYLTISPEI